jgi:lipoprotein-releasing system permease protein
VKFELFVALRYLRAKRRQAVVSVITLVSVVGVAAGVTALIIALALNTGFREEFQERILGATAHVNLMGAGGTPVGDYRHVLERVSTAPEIVTAVPAIYGLGLVQSAGRQQPATLKGIEVEDAGLVVPALTEGSLEAFAAVEPTPAIILGKDLAEALVASAGEHVRVVGVDGELSPLGRMPRIRNFRVAAVFESGLWDYDANWALVPLPAAQDFYRLRPDQVSTIELRIDDLYRAEEVARRVKEVAGPGFQTSTWIELNRPLFSALRLEKLAMFVAIGLIVLVASLNIIGTLTLMVMEKSRDIAIVVAMGGTRRTLTRIFMLQGLIIGVLGTLIGVGLGVFGAWYLDAYRVFRLEAQVYSIPYVPFRTTLTDVVAVSAAAVLISFLATLYPARAAAGMDPVEGLRYE